MEIFAMCTQLFIFRIFLISNFLSGIYGKVCPGFCVPKELCEMDGGKVVGYCVNQHACCDVSQSPKRRLNETFPRSKYSSTCGQEVSLRLENPREKVSNGNKPIRFLSPHYPAYSSGSLVCQLGIILEKNTAGLRLDLDVFELDKKIHVHGVGGGALNGGGANFFSSAGGGPAFGGRGGAFGGGNLGESGNFKCDADMFFIKGFSDWMTDPRCGTLSGVSLLMDIDKIEEHPEKKIILLFIMSSKKYRWKIRIHQITAKKLRKSELCLNIRRTGWEKSPNFMSKIPGPIKQNISQNLNISNTPPAPVPDGISSPISPLEFEFPWKWHAHIVSENPSPAAGTGMDTETVSADHITCRTNIIQSSGTVQKFEFQKFAPGLKKLCSGTIIDDRHILTTASCILQNFESENNFLTDNQIMELKNLKILTPAFCKKPEFGGKDRTDGNATALGLYSIQNIIIHFNYVPGFLTNDVAIIRTQNSIHFDLEKPEIQTQSVPLLNTLDFRRDSLAKGPFLFRGEKWVKPAENSDCISTQSLNLHLALSTLKELQNSNKYKGITSNWICFKILPSPQFSEAPPPSAVLKNGPNFHANYLKNEIEGYKSLAGSSLIGGNLNSNSSESATVNLAGIFSHVYYKQVDVISNYSVDFQFQPPWPWYFSFTRFANLSYIGSSKTTATSLAYFTSIEFYRKWILMAIS